MTTVNNKWRLLCLSLSLFVTGLCSGHLIFPCMHHFHPSIHHPSIHPSTVVALSLFSHREPHTHTHTHAGGRRVIGANDQQGSPQHFHTHFNIWACHLVPPPLHQRALFGESLDVAGWFLHSRWGWGFPPFKLHFEADTGFLNGSNGEQTDTTATRGCSCT